MALFVGSPLAGIYADHTSSRRWPLLIGLVALAASTLLLCFGNSIGLLILGRILQGLSASIVWSVGCALLVDTMESAVGVAMGYVGISMSVGLLIAPVVGGAVYAAAGYYAVYYIAFGVVVVDILLRLFMIEKKVARQWINENPVTGPSETEASQIDIEQAAPPSGRRSQDHQNSVQASEETGQLQQDHSEEKRTDTANPSSQGPMTPNKRTHMSRAIKALLKSPRLLAALWGLVVEAGIM